jgi:abnormal spindle-like microcephaly-associated protein
MNDSVDFEPTNLDLLATSTPKRIDSADRRSSRRSWFENSSSIKYSIAVESNQRNVTRNRHSDVEMETLILSHFTNPPRIGFGTCKVGITKHRTLIVKNPHDYAQNVKVERYPHKKNFFVNSTEFSVDGESVYHLDISWSPENEGNVREMIQFSVDDAYRLQAFVFGSCQNPQKKKKMVIYLLKENV